MSGPVNNSRLGYFGKYPGYRDFVQRGLPVHFIEKWRRWIADVMYTGNSLLKGQWLDVYLTSPVWRFAIRDHELGDGVWLGALMPSMDARQRYFPLCVVVCLPPEPLFQLIRRAEPFLIALEEAMIEILQEPYPDTDELAKHLDALWKSSATDCLYKAIEPEAKPAKDRHALHELDRFIAGTNDPAGIWHAANVANGKEYFKVLPALPDPVVFVRLQEATVTIEQSPENEISDEEEHLTNPETQAPAEAQQ